MIHDEKEIAHLFLICKNIIVECSDLQRPDRSAAGSCIIFNEMYGFKFAWS